MPNNKSNINQTSFDDESVNTPDTSLKEKPIDEFSGIDVLISTPESLEDIKRLLEDTKRESIKADEMMAEAQQLLKQVEEYVKKAHDIKENSKDRIKHLSAALGNMEQNLNADIDEPLERTIEVKSADNDVATHISSSDDSQSLPNDKPRKKSLLYAAIAAAVALVILVLIFAIPKSSDKLQQEESVAVENKDKDSDENKSVENNSAVVNDSESNAPARKVDKVTFDGYTPFEIIVVKHYGDRTHMKEVLDFNIKEGVFKDWANIPIGTEILLPEF